VFRSLVIHVEYKWKVSIQHLYVISQIRRDYGSEGEYVLNMLASLPRSMDPHVRQAKILRSLNRRLFFTYFIEARHAHEKSVRLADYLVSVHGGNMALALIF
jgi:hypothetical protein